MAYLVMMAFRVDQMQQAANKTYRALLGGLKTKVKLRDSVRTVFHIVAAPSTHKLHFEIADMYCIWLI